jgi:hypothetical protein
MANFFRNAPAKMLNKEIDFDSDIIVATLHTSTYAINADTHIYVSSLTNELSTANGYTAGGITLTSKTVTYTAAASWGTSRAASTAYTLGKVVRPATSNGFLYRASIAGTTSASLPTYPTVIGTSVVDGSVTWTCMGKGIIVIDAADVSWTSATFSAVRYLVISDRQTAGVPTTQPLIGYIDYGSNQAAAGGAFTQVFDAQGIFQIFVP